MPMPHISSFARVPSLVERTTDKHKSFYPFGANENTNTFFLFFSQLRKWQRLNQLQLQPNPLDCWWAIAISDGFTNALVKPNETFTSTRTIDKKEAKLNEIHNTAFFIWSLSKSANILTFLY